MSLQQINLGISPSGAGGDDFRTGSEKINQNFQNIDNALAQKANKTDVTASLDLKANKTDVIPNSKIGAPNGVAPLDANNLIPSTYLPSYVDDVLEYATVAGFPVTGEASKIYVTLDTNRIYRWSGSTYVEISSAALADAAIKLNTARTVAATGDATWSVSFDGSANVSAALTLANSGVTAGTYPKVTVDAKGRVIGGSALLASDVPILNQDTTGNAGTASKLKALLNNSDPSNTAYFNIGVDTNAAILDSGKLGTGTALPILLKAGGSASMQINTDGATIFNPISWARGQVTSYATMGAPYTANFAAVPLGTAQGQAAGISFYGTFTGTSDNGPRRAADIFAGYTGGTWGYEYLSFNVGGATDAGNITSAKMVIGANGNVSIGDASLTNARLRVTSPNKYTVWSSKEILIESLGGSNPGIGFHAQGNAQAAVFKFYGGSTQFECRSSDDAIFIPIAASNFITSSDYRLKDINGPITNSGSFIDSLKPKQGTWKADGSKFVGFIAHEVQEVSPSSVHGTKDAVDEKGKPIYQGMNYGSSEIIANLVAEVQSLRHRLAILEAK